MKTNAKTFLVAPKGAVSHANVSQNQSNSMTTILEKWYTTGEMMRHFGVSSRTLLMWRKKQLIPFVKMNGVVMHPIHLINELMLTKAQSNCWRTV